MKTFSLHYKKFQESVRLVEKYLDLQLSQKAVVEELNNLSPENREKFSSIMPSGVSFIDETKALQNSSIIYNAIIISLYGSFEQYINDTLSDYLLMIAEHQIGYSNMNEKVKTKHIRSVGDYLSNPQRYKNYEITVERVIYNAFQLLYNQESEFKENAELLLSHSGNLTYEQVKILMGDFGINSFHSSIIADVDFQEYWCKEKECSLDMYYKLEKQKDYPLFRPLDELVKNRNIIAHGISDQRVSLSTIKTSWIPFLLLFCKLTMEKIMVFLFNELLKNDKLFELGYPIKCFNKSIIAINCSNQTLMVGDYIYCVNSKNKKVLQIETIEIDNTSYEKVEKCNQNIGIGFHSSKKNNISKNYKYYCINTL